MVKISDDDRVSNVWWSWRNSIRQFHVPHCHSTRSNLLGFWSQSFSSFTYWYILSVCNWENTLAVFGKKICSLIPESL